MVVDVCKADATNALGMARGFEGGFNGYGAGEPWEKNAEKSKAMKLVAASVNSVGIAAAAVGSHPKAVGEGRDVAALWRWVVDVEAGELISSTRMCTEPSDFPCINPDFVGLPHRYAYTTGRGDIT